MYDEKVIQYEAYAKSYDHLAQDLKRKANIYLNLANGFKERARIRKYAIRKYKKELKNDNRN